jgi:hypothetical protein
LTMLQTELDTLSDQTPGEGSNSLAEK